MFRFICVLMILFIAQGFCEEKNNAVIPVPKLENDFYDWYKRHETVKKYIKEHPADLVFIGDSITHMFGGTPESEKPFGHEVWKKYYSHRNAVNMGFGWDRTQNVLWRLNNGEFENIAPKVVVLLIGTNNLTGTKNAPTNTPQEIFEGIRKVCMTIHEKSPQTKIIALSVLPRSPLRFVEPIKEINKKLQDLDKEDYITILNLTEEFAEADGLPKKSLMRDSVHPGIEGYKIWAAKLEPVLSKLLNDKMVTP